MLISKQATTVTKYHMNITRVDILAWLRSSHVIPDDAEVFVRVPGGGDWSNMNLDVDKDAPLSVTWTEKKVT